jgi:hypothetical protein
MQVSELKSLIGNGKIASVTFIKRTDGTERRMLCRTGVKLGAKGSGERAYDPESKNLLLVYDMQKHGYRMIPAESVLEVRARGERRVFRGI